MPAILAVLVLLAYSLRLFRAYVPRWAKSFVEEEKQAPHELGSAFWSRPMPATLGLLITSMIGFAAHMVISFLPTFSIYNVYPTIAWVICLVPVIDVC